MNENQEFSGVGSERWWLRCWVDTSIVPDENVSMIAVHHEERIFCTDEESIRRITGETARDKSDGSLIPRCIGTEDRLIVRNG